MLRGHGEIILFLKLNILKTERDTGFISVEDVQEIVHAESNGYATV